MRACFNGCSFTFGEGFAENQRDTYIYDRLVSNFFNFERTNIAKPGSSNHTIFMRSAQALQSKAFDILLVQWTALNRLWLSPGPDSYFFTNDDKHPDFQYQNLYVPPGELKKFKTLALLLNHDYQNILDLVDYCNFLDLIAVQTKTKIVYVNGLVPWESDLTTLLSTNLGNSLSAYSKEILDFDNRDDSEIIYYFEKLQSKFATLDQSKWVNVFDSFFKLSIDKGPEGHHPGIKSHQIMADKIISYMSNLLHQT